MELTDLNEMDPTDIYRSFQPKTKEYTFFSASQGTERHPRRETFT
jgi:exonuclease III